MMDLMYLSILAAASLATYGLLKVCAWLFQDNHGERL
jgi:hypothetical protein